MYINDSVDYERGLTADDEKMLIIAHSGTWLTPDELRELADLLDRQNEGDTLDEGGQDYNGDYADFYITVTENGNIIY